MSSHGQRAPFKPRRWIGPIKAFNPLLPITTLPEESVAVAPSCTLHIVLCPLLSVTVKLRLIGPNVTPVISGCAAVCELHTRFCVLTPGSELGNCCHT